MNVNYTKLTLCVAKKAAFTTYWSIHTRAMRDIGVEKSNWTCGNGIGLGSSGLRRSPRMAVAQWLRKRKQIICTELTLTLKSWHIEPMPNAANELRHLSQRIKSIFDTSDLRVPFTACGWMKLTLRQDLQIHVLICAFSIFSLGPKVWLSWNDLFEREIP